jgi:predicted DNA-binding transcriptional regulator YafY
VPIWTDRGRRGGYGLDADATMPPINLTPAEATAIALALRAAADSPLALDGRSALTKILNAMSPAGRAGADELAARIHLCDTTADADEILRELGRAISDRRVVELDDVDRRGTTTERRRIEPGQLVRVDGRWYVHGWCHRRQAHRTFRAGRIARIVVLRERSPARDASPLPAALDRGRLALTGS